MTIGCVGEVVRLDALVAMKNLDMDATLHPEDAEADRCDRRVELGRDRQAEYGIGLRPVDDAVVPQPRNRVRRVVLFFGLGADPRSELHLFLRGRFLSARHAAAGLRAR